MSAQPTKQPQQRSTAPAASAAAMAAPATAQEHAQLRQQLLRDAMRNAHATQLVADDTAVALSRQTGQIAAISTKLDGMERDLTTADHHTTSIGSWFGMIWNSIRGAPKADGPPKPGEKAQAALDLTRGGAPAQAQKGAALAPGPRGVAQSNSTTTRDPDEAAEDALLDQLHSSVLGVMSSAKAQNQVVRAQTAALAEAGDKMDKVHVHMDKTTRNVKRLI